MNHIKHIKTEIAQLIDLIAGKFDRRHRTEFLNNRYVDRQNRQLWDHPTETCDEAEKEAIWRKIEVGCGFVASRSLKLVWRYAAAACLVGLLIAGGIWRYMDVHALRYTDITACSDTTYVLPDTSTVVLKQGSKMRFATDFIDKRDVWLVGDALFEVKKKGLGRTFRVHINKAFIEVKGTKFLVEQQQECSRVTLFNGKIEFNVEATNDKYVLHPMDNLSFNAETGRTAVSSLKQMVYEDGKYVFTDILLKDLVRTIGQLYSVDIELDKGINSEATLTGSINRDEELQRVIRKIGYTLNLNYEFEQNKIVLRKND